MIPAPTMEDQYLAPLLALSHGRFRSQEHKILQLCLVNNHQPEGMTYQYNTTQHRCLARIRSTLGNNRPNTPLQALGLPQHLILDLGLPKADPARSEDREARHSSSRSEARPSLHRLRWLGKERSLNTTTARMIQRSERLKAKGVVFLGHLQEVPDQAGAKRLYKPSKILCILPKRDQATRTLPASRLRYHSQTLRNIHSRLPTPWKGLIARFPARCQASIEVGFHGQQRPRNESHHP